LQQGKIVKAAGGFFTVRDEYGEEYVCRARGMLKRGSKSLMVGDDVLFESPQKEPSCPDGEGIIEKMLPRSNLLQRPRVANVDQLAVIMSLRSPDCDWQLISRMLVLAEKEDLFAFICLNKTDLIVKNELSKINDRLDHYPYKIIYTSALNGTGLDKLEEYLKGQCTVLAGPSGAGKSSLLNALQPGLALQTGTVSDKIKRGRHTTRQAELLTLQAGGSVVDTPGFTRLDFSGLDIDSLADYFPEFEPLRGQCGFRDCRHISEHQCAVQEEIGISLNPMRYEHYKSFIGELEKQGVY